MATFFPYRVHTVICVLSTCVLIGQNHCGTASAHEGPPFPIVVDKPAAGYLVSVWADPDIGEATFYVIVETPEGKIPAEKVHVSMWTEPKSGRLDRTNYETVRQSLQNKMQFLASPHFDQRDMWDVGFRVATPNGKSEELTTEIESTPPGFGIWDLAIYLFPFVLIAALWCFGMLRRMARPRIVD